MAKTLCQLNIPELVQIEWHQLLHLYSSSNSLCYVCIMCYVRNSHTSKCWLHETDVLHFSPKQPNGRLIYLLVVYCNPFLNHWRGNGHSIINSVVRLLWSAIYFDF